MKENIPIVYVVDDDLSVRRAIKRLIESVGLQVQLFDSAEKFPSGELPDVPSCLVLDVRLPGKSGLEFQQELIKTGGQIATIFITAHGDIPMTVRAMKSGAVEFLAKPFRDQDLLDAIQVALARDRDRRQRDMGIATLRERFRLLSPRESEVIVMVASGMPNKHIAARIGTTENTVEVHRSRAMDKMQAQSLADLVKMIEKLQDSSTTLP
jgi:RNA polymerase sigma factor (sigma-70 family)